MKVLYVPYLSLRCRGMGRPHHYAGVWYSVHRHMFSGGRLGSWESWSWGRAMLSVIPFAPKGSHAARSSLVGL